MDTTHTRQTSIRQHALVGVGLGVIFALLIGLTWMKWFDLYVDSFRDVWVAEQLVQGKALYREVLYEYGFLIPITFSGLFRWFGTHLYVLVFAGIIIGGATTSLIYAITHQLLKDFDSGPWVQAVPGLASLVYLLVFAFSPSSSLFNTIVPYTYSTTVFVLAVLTALYAFLRFTEQRRAHYVWVWGIAISIAACCRPMMMVPVGAAFCIPWILWIWHNRSIRLASLIFGVPILITTLAYALVLGIHGATQEFIDSNILHALWASDTYFSHFHMGLTDIRTSTLGILYATGHHILFLLIPLAIGRWVFKKPWFATLLALFMGAFVIWRIDPYVMTDLFRVLSVLLPLAAIGYGYRAARMGHPTDLAMLATILVSGAVGLRVGLRMIPVDYGFCLLIPGLITYFVLYFRAAAIVGRHDDTPQWRVAIVGAAGLLFLAFSTLYAARTHRAYWTEATYARSTAYGTVTTTDTPRNRYFWQTLDYITSHSSPTDMVLVIPEGISLNWLSNRQTPLKYYHLNPHLAAQINATELVAQLKDSTLKWMVIPTRESPEYDSPIFGVDYHQELHLWVQKEFTLVEQYGAIPSDTDQAGVQIWLRNAR